MCFRKVKLMKKQIALLLMLLLVIACFAASAELTIPESVTEIQEEAFAGCESAEVLTILNPNAWIANDALDGSGITLIRCYRAATDIIAFANEHSIPVEYLDAEHITVWTSLPDLTARQIGAFKAANPQYSDYVFDVVSASEGDLASDIINCDVPPDIFGFPQDQLAVVKQMGKLDPVSGADSIRSRNSEGAVSAAEVGGVLYAYPMTADNGFFLYYDKSVVSDPSSLESILTACETAGKKFYMQVDSGWYQVAFFFGAGCDMTFTVSEDGTFESVDIHYANANGVKAMKSLIKTIGSPAFENGSLVDEAENWAAIVSGTWDANSAKNYLGSSFAAAKLPTIDGYQMKSYGGFKMLGVAPQNDNDRSAACHALANWLTNEACQLQRYEEYAWGPSNIAAQQSEAVQGDEALTALADQAQYAVPQGQIPGGYWDLAAALINEIISGQLADADDDQIMERLEQFEADIIALTNAAPSSAVIGISMPTNTLARWVSDANAIKGILENDGFTVDLRFAGYDPDTQASQIGEMVENDVDVLIVTPVIGNSLGNVLNAAMNKGIPVIAYDRLLMNTAAVDYYVTFSNYMVGTVQGSYIRDMLDLDNASGPFNLEITAGDPWDSNGRIFYNGAIDVLAPYIDNGKLIVKSGQIEFSAVATDGWSTENAQARAATILESYYADGSGIDAWLCINDSLALGVIHALEEAGYEGSWPVITGQDCDKENIRKIIAGKQSMSIFKDTRTEAARAAEMAEQILLGEGVDVNNFEDYNNGEKYVPTYECAPVFVDVNNYEELLIEPGYYSADDFR